jgi:hypothetical protein
MRHSLELALLVDPDLRQGRPAARTREVDELRLSPEHPPPVPGGHAEQDSARTGIEERRRKSPFNPKSTMADRIDAGMDPM